MNYWFINNYDNKIKKVNIETNNENIEKINWNKLYFNLLDNILLFIPIIPNHIYGRLIIVILYIFLNNYYTKIKQLYILEGNRNKLNYVEII